MDNFVETVDNSARQAYNRDYSARYRREMMGRRAAERLDVLEPPPPRKGCNAHDEHGRRCGARVVIVSGGPFSERRLCHRHRDLYLMHDHILALARGS